ncbi:hypothetical protein F3Y30_07485 [Sinorhizobium sp. BG8]|nr:hypothetical protein F3Y30_07485 [Sinorhizobium sp. BG8]
MTATRSQISAMTPRWCEIIRIDTPDVSLSSRIRCRIWASMVTSSAVVGSSAMRSAGRIRSAAAIATRWSMPPENWKG